LLNEIFRCAGTAACPHFLCINIPLFAHTDANSMQKQELVLRICFGCLPQADEKPARIQAKIPSNSFAE